MGSFTSISICALLCYLFLFITFINAKRNRIINAFLYMVAVLMMWVGGSLFMRMQMWPSVKFWYDVSLFGMWLIPLTLQRYIREFMGKKIGLFDIALDLSIIALNIVNIATGLFLKAPTAVVQANGDPAFVYTFTLGVIPMVVVGVVAFSKIVYGIVMYSVSDSALRKQFMPIIIGLSCMLLGNVIIISPLFAGIPLDIVSGVINAFCMFYMLYQRRLFKLTLLASRRSMYVLSFAATCILFAEMLVPIQRVIREKFAFFAQYEVLVIAMSYTLSTVIICGLMKNAIDHIFVKDEQAQAKILQDFTLSVSKTLKVSEILENLIEVTQRAIDVSWVCVCTRSADDRYTITRGSNPLENKVIVFSTQNPIIQHLTNHDACLMIQDLHTISGYRSLWEDEKRMLTSMNIRCFVPLRVMDDLIGVMLLSAKSKGRKFTYSDESFLMSVKNVVSIAIKNATLYEKADHDARTDDLTGLLNRKYFHLTLTELFKQYQGHDFSLMLINVDDFKLYNQLYGDANGDIALQNIAGIIRRGVEENGRVARYSGKEFAVILPDCNAFFARNLAENIRSQISRLNLFEDEIKLKALTVSVGICASPCAASTVKQLIENAEQAVYQVKRNGKNGTLVYAAGADMIIGDKAEPVDYQRVYSEYAPTIYALTAAIDTKDHYTFKHSKNVAYYATHLASAYGLSGDDIEIINEAALLHDVGKIGISESILYKKDSLTDSEFKEIRKHVENSVSIIRHLPSLDYVIPAVIGHHERYDGNGYPRRISGEDIPLYARILCVADSFDAMTSKRVYKEAYPLERALTILSDQAGKQFDPKLALMFISEIRSGRIELQNSEKETDYMISPEQSVR